MSETMRLKAWINLKIMQTYFVHIHPPIAILAAILDVTVQYLSPTV